jgi:hypothetical protein
MNLSCTCYCFHQPVLFMFIHYWKYSSLNFPSFYNHKCSLWFHFIPFFTFFSSPLWITTLLFRFLYVTNFKILSVSPAFEDSLKVIIILKDNLFIIIIRNIYHQYFTKHFLNPIQPICFLMLRFFVNETNNHFNSSNLGCILALSHFKPFLF